MSPRIKLSRRELFKKAAVMGLSSGVVFPALSSLLYAGKARALAPPNMGVLTLVCGEGANMATSGSGTTRFTSSGALTGRLTAGLSGLAGVEAHSMVIEGIGYRHLPQGGSAQFQRVTDPDHERSTLSALCGDVKNQISLNQHLKTAFGKKIADFTATTAVENDLAKAYSVSRDAAGNPISPNTTLDDLIADLTLQSPVSGGGSTLSSRQRATKDMLENLLTVGDATRNELDADDKNQMDLYLEQMTNQHDFIGAGNATCSFPAPVNSTDSWRVALEAAKIMMNAMNCGALDFGTIVMLPSNGTSPAFPGFSGSNPLSYNGLFTGLGNFVQSHVTESGAFVQKVCSARKGNHFVSHLNNNEPSGGFDASSYWGYAGIWQNEAQLVIDKQISDLHRMIFQQARATPGSGGTLADSMLLMTKYGFDDSDTHTFESTLTLLTTDRPNVIHWDRAKVPSSSEIMSGRARQSHKQSQLLLSILRLFDAGAATFADAQGVPYDLAGA